MYECVRVSEKQSERRTRASKQSIGEKVSTCRLHQCHTTKKIIIISKNTDQKERRRRRRRRKRRRKRSSSRRHTADAPCPHIPTQRHIRGEGDKHHHINQNV